MKKTQFTVLLLAVTSLSLQACMDDTPPPTPPQSRGVAWTCTTVSTCNAPGLYEPVTQANTHRLCAGASDLDVVLPGDRIALDWEQGWIAGCEMNEGRDVHYSGVDDPEPLTCGDTWGCRAKCEPLFEACTIERGD